MIIDGARITNRVARIAIADARQYGRLCAARVGWTASCCAVLIGCWGCSRDASPPSAVSAAPPPTATVSTPAASSEPDQTATQSEPDYLSDELPAAQPAAQPALPTETAPLGVPEISLPDRDELVVTYDQPLDTSSRHRALSGRKKLPFSLIDEAAILADDASLHRPALPNGPKVKLSLFDAPPAEGHSFVFVIDRSASMGSGGLGAIGAAAKELEAQLGSLTGDQLFQVVAYNQSAVYFTGRELVPASEGNKQALVAYVRNLADFGQTEHERGLVAAFRLKPEVIYLLTDGGDPHLKPGQVKYLREQAGERTTIHCLHFGTGSEDAIPPDHFLRRLAAETRGSYAFISVRPK